LGLLTVVSCATSVQTIRDDPQRFSGRTVTIAGTVGRAIPVPLTDYSVQTVSDRTGSVVVVAVTRRDRDQKARLRGRVVAFPEGKTVGKADAATREMTELLVESGVASKEGAQRAAERVLAVVSRIAAGLGSLFVIVEA
jgi:hypothetical protein